MRQTEIRDPEITARIEQEVCGLDVAVNDAHVMGVFKGLGGLHAQTRHGAEVSRVFPRFSEECDLCGIADC